MFDIIKGHFNELARINDDISHNRLQICYLCPLYSKDLGGVCSNKLWLNVNTGETSIFKKPGYKTGCSCKLKSKTRQPDAKCPIYKC